MLNTRVAAMCAAPDGCGFLLAVEATGLSPADAAQPSVALHLAAEAMSALSPWAPNHEQIIATTLAHGPRLRSLCQEVLAEPETEWWFAPLERHCQEWISRSGEAPSADKLTTPIGSPDTFARRTQKPGDGFFTSTGIDGTSGAIALIADGYGDYEVDLPLVRYRVGIQASARVLRSMGQILGTGFVRTTLQSASTVD